MSYAALVIGVVGTGYSVYKGAHDSAQKKKAAKELTANTRRPYYNKPKEIDDVYNLNASEINDTGLQDYATQISGQSEANGIDAILKSGGKADFSTIHNAFGSQLGQALQAIKSQRANNIAKFNESAYAKGKASDTEFTYNQDEPYRNSRQLAALLQTEAAAEDANTTQNAVNGAISLASNYATATTSPGSNKTVKTADPSLAKTTLDVKPLAPIQQNTTSNTITPRPGSIADPDYDEFTKWLYKERNQPI